MRVRERLYSRLHQNEQQSQLCGESSINVRHFGGHVEGLGAKYDVTEQKLTQVDLKNILHSIALTLN